MSLWRPDPTFYPSPKLAMQAPPEKLAYVAMQMVALALGVWKVNGMGLLP